MKKKRAIMVALSAAVIIPALPASALAQIRIICPTSFKVGNIAKCGKTGRVVIDPDGNLKSTVNCLEFTNTPKPGRCTVETTAGPVTKNVKVSFATSKTMIKMGANSFLLDRLKMSYSAAPTPVGTITLTPGEVSAGGAIINIGGRVTTVADSPTGMYSGEVVINANLL